MVGPAFPELVASRGRADPFEPPLGGAPVKRDVDFAAQVEPACGEWQEAAGKQTDPDAMVLAESLS